MKVELERKFEFKAYGYQWETQSSFSSCGDFWPFKKTENIFTRRRDQLYNDVEEHLGLGSDVVVMANTGPPLMDKDPPHHMDENFYNLQLCEEKTKKESLRRCSSMSPAKKKQLTREEMARYEALSVQYAFKKMARPLPSAVVCAAGSFMGVVIFPDSTNVDLVNWEWEGVDVHKELKEKVGSLEKMFSEDELTQEDMANLDMANFLVGDLPRLCAPAKDKIEFLEKLLQKWAQILEEDIIEIPKKIRDKVDLPFVLHSIIYLTIFSRFTREVLKTSRTRLSYRCYAYPRGRKHLVTVAFLPSSFFSILWAGRRNWRFLLECEASGGQAISQRQ